MRVNDRWAEIIGYSLDELHPVTIQTWKDRAHPSDLAKAEELLQAHFDGDAEAYRFEVRMRHKDGHWVWVLERGKVITRTEDNEPGWMFGTHQDINEQKLQEEHLRKSQIFLDRTGRAAKRRRLGT